MASQMRSQPKPAALRVNRLLAPLANSVGKLVNLKENYALLLTKSATNVREKGTLLLFVSQARNLSIPWEMKTVSAKTSCTMSVKKRHMQSLTQTRSLIKC